MRVNVTYSVDLGEVKQLIQEILLKIEDDVEEVSGNFLATQDNVNSDNEKEAVEAIEKCRKNLSSIDHSLYDCWNILNGYQQTLLQMKQANSMEEAIPEKNVGEHVEGG